MFLPVSLATGNIKKTHIGTVWPVLPYDGDCIIVKPWYWMIAIFVYYIVTCCSCWVEYNGSCVSICVCCVCVLTD